MPLGKHIIFVTSHPMTVGRFLLPHISALMATAHVEVITNANQCRGPSDFDIPTNVLNINIARDISLVSDAVALWNLYWYFLTKKPDAIHTITPKAGLLGILAAWLAGVPIRVHSFTGQVWVTRSGLIRHLLKFTDTCLSCLASAILVDSPSQLRFLVDHGVLKVQKAQCLGCGSICGVDIARFMPSSTRRRIIRRDYQTCNDTFIFLYLGRLTRDKGVYDLARAFLNTYTKRQDIELWLVGPDEDNCWTDIKTMEGFSRNNIKRFEWTAKPEEFMQSADVFCLPSYREGFGLSVIEAAACGVPALVSNIYGLNDTVIDGVTGWKHDAGNTYQLAFLLDYLASNKTEVKKCGVTARKYVSSLFSQELIVKEMVDFYQRRFNEKTN